MSYFIFYIVILAGDYIILNDDNRNFDLFLSCRIQWSWDLIGSYVMKLRTCYDFDEIAKKYSRWLLGYKYQNKQVFSFMMLYILPQHNPPINTFIYSAGEKEMKETLDLRVNCYTVINNFFLLSPFSFVLCFSFLCFFLFIYSLACGFLIKSDY